jgi:hypothetical protein
VTAFPTTTKTATPIVTMVATTRAATQPTSVSYMSGFSWLLLPRL